ncbi:MAG: hypothetical protein ACREYC_20030 [Gammaproteobacteria bacterium]
MNTTPMKSNSIKTLSAAVALVTATAAAPAFAGQETNGVVLNGVSFNGISLNGLEVNGLVWNGGGVPLAIKIVRVILPEEGTSPVK